ncbi:hypothetical protein [Ureibacillus thermosphaericus]|uniref:Phage protein n=1 Tax=Ureibacillus thermosphaericus TaxID=51173 RepID=A0A840Q0N9_URETH|nr:hypothetical protein [Ureibacillus thermosphaericus]MBB5148636.1 hypothetical protein [Ureibacillus thermosphaericus]NKZ31351.1 hypothetical protein [Ureibacillus thermosphaericus]
MPTVFENLGFKATVTNDKLKIEIPIRNLVEGFKDSTNNYDGSIVKRGCRQEFAKYVAQALVDGSNPDTGDSPIMEAIEKTFEELFEGAEDFIKYQNEEDY